MSCQDFVNGCNAMFLIIVHSFRNFWHDVHVNRFKISPHVHISTFSFKVHPQPTSEELRQVGTSIFIENKTTGTKSFNFSENNVTFAKFRNGDSRSKAAAAAKITRRGEIKPGWRASCLGRPVYFQRLDHHNGRFRDGEIIRVRIYIVHCCQTIEPLAQFVRFHRTISAISFSRVAGDVSTQGGGSLLISWLVIPRFLGNEHWRTTRKKLHRWEISWRLVVGKLH